MFDEDQDTLAAEYVLGTLSAEEREHAEALLSFDPGFEAAVRQWERRLGELNVMVEAVEPPTELWDKIKKEVSPATAPVDAEAAHSPDAASATEAESLRDLDARSTVGDMASDLFLVEKALSSPAAEIVAEMPPHDSIRHDSIGHGSIGPPLLAPEPRHIEHGADVIYLAKRVRRWRGLTIGFGAIAALLAAYVAVSQVAPDLIPPQLRAAGARMVARTEGAGRAQQDRLVAVLQQQPTAPAFLLTVDTQNRTLIVRRVSATPETGRSYELWLISSRFPAPRSLGIVGNDEFTQRALPGNVDLDTLRAATYAVSLEPSGGSPSGAPTGPVLFTGKAVESLPASPPPKPAKT
jgi:anti-sigma-K factor RskA